jgi:hypothetical protein
MTRINSILFFFVFLSLWDLKEAQDLEQLIFCESDNVITEACSEIDEPVCAFYPNFCETAPCPEYREFNNSCLACQDPKVEAYFLGTCEDINDGPVPEPVDPFTERKVVTDIQVEVEVEVEVRVEYEVEETAEELEGGEEEITEEEFDICIVDCPESVVSATTTENADEQGRIYCNLPPIGDVETAVCPAVYAPVCSYYDGCDRIDCGVTASNSCVACQQFGALYYTEGPCLGDENGPLY